MDRYRVKPFVCDYAVVDDTGTALICNLKSNAEYIADILNADSSEYTAYTYNVYVSRKWDIKERKQGKWIYDKKSDNWRCSECNETPKTLGYVGTSAFMTEHFKFCNHCGAEMRYSDGN